MKILFFFSPFLDFVSASGLTGFNSPVQTVEAGTNKKIRKYALSAGTFSKG